MSKKKVLSIFLVIALCIAVPCAAFAHSGRTDSSGGHKDNKNVSGLGSYHYHCGGYPAHLHENGVCPYAAKASSTKSANASTASTTVTYSKPSFPVVVNGTNLNATNTDYYPIVIDDVTYVPLSSEVIKALELNGGWVDSSKGLVLNSN